MITTYTELKTEVANWLLKTNLTADIPTFIQLMEARIKRDPRARKLQATTLSVSADNKTLPSDFHSLNSLGHDGGTYYGPLNIIAADQLPGVRAAQGDTGPPTHASVIDNALRMAPVPDATYTLKMTYWRTIAALSSTNATNWILDDHPDIYLYGTLAESAPFLKDDGRIAVWAGRYDAALEELHIATQDRQFGGGSSQRRFSPIG